jgi:hypothetical protein
MTGLDIATRTAYQRSTVLFGPLGRTDFILCGSGKNVIATNAGTSSNVGSIIYIVLAGNAVKVTS